MKKIIILTVAIIIQQSTINNCFAQSPNAIPYQAVARNSSGNLIASQNISLRFSIHDGTATGTVVYKETQAVTTNTLGLFVCNIGQGTPVIGTFNAINWASGNKFTQVEMDVAGGTTYVDMGTSQMLSVPYALYAATSGSGAVGATGATGVAGNNGTNGAMGATGATGVAGTNGTNGIDGATGATGTNGTNGTNGADGATGATGADGLVGPTGAPGSGSVSGTTNFVGKFTPNGTVIGNSQIIDNSVSVAIGTASPSSKFEVQSISPNTSIKGWNFASNGVGVSGVSNFGANSYGIYGESTSGYAGYFAGKVQVNGTAQTTGNIGINNVPNYPLSFENTVGDKISFFGSAGPHYGIGIQGGLMQFYTPITASDIVFGTGQSSSMVTNVTFKGNGTVGIGTTTPAATLHVARGAAFNGTAEFDGSFNNSHFNYSPSEDTYIRGGAAGSKVFINDVNFTGDVLISAPATSNVGIGTTAPQNKLEVAENADFTGNVGIGTATPASKLDVLGNVNFTGNVGASGTASGFRFDDRSLGAANGWQWYASGGKARLYDQLNGFDRLVIDNAGNVGIGTGAPGSPLHVASNASNETAFIVNTGNGAALLANNLGGGVAIAANAVSTLPAISATNTSSGKAINATSNGSGSTINTTNNGSGAALEINGPIKVSGNQSAFVLVADASNLSSGNTVIDINNVNSNNDPNAMIFITSQNNNSAAIRVEYDSNTGHWFLQIFGSRAAGHQILYYNNSNGTDLVATLPINVYNNSFFVGDRINILIIKQ